MMSLTELQQEFIKSLRDISHGKFYQHMRSHPRLSSHDQLSIYQTNFIATLQKAIKTAFPVCRKLVGDDFFTGMMNLYISETPSTSPDLNHYGDSFASFIASFDPVRSLPYLADVARLEWAWHSAFTAPPQMPFDFETLATCSDNPETILFSLPPLATLLKTPYPVHTIWETNQDNYEGDTTINLVDDTTYYFLIWRDKLERRIDSLTRTEWQFLRWIDDALTLDKICEEATMHLPESDITSTLSLLVSQGWISHFSKKAPTPL